MSDVKWIKITTDMFDNRKIKYLRKLPEGDSIVLIWVMLLTLAGRCNSGGMIFLTENIPYTAKLLADELDFEETTVQLALNALEQLDMIRSDVFLYVTGWEEHQNIEGMERIREQTRQRVARHREKQKLIQSRSGNATVTLHNAIEEDIDKEEDKEKEHIDYMWIMNAFNSTCVSLPALKSMSEARKKAVRARLNTYSRDDFKTLFEKAEASSFLKGQNNRNWIASFDWLIKDSNMAKVLEGNYDDRSGSGSSFSGNNFNRPVKTASAEALEASYRMMEEWGNS